MDEQEKVQSWIAAWLMRSTDCAEFSQHGFSIYNLQGANHLRRQWPQLPARSSQQHHPVLHLPFQWSQLRLQRMRPWHAHRRMHRSQMSRELIHGLKHGRRGSASDRNWWCDRCSSSSLWKSAIRQAHQLLDFSQTGPGFCFPLFLLASVLSMAQCLWRRSVMWMYIRRQSTTLCCDVAQGKRERLAD